MTATLIPNATEQPVRSVTFAPGATEATTDYVRAVPFTMPSSQEYYWRHGWQQGERETLASLADGEGILFDSDDAEDIVRWLHEDDPDSD